MRRTFKILLPILLALLMPVSSINAQNNKFGVSDSTYNYYLKCLSMQSEPAVLKMADTLYAMAEKEEDVRMMVVSTTLKMDHYYYTKNLDSLKVYVNHVKEYAEETDLMRYFYFAWSRLILYYVGERYLDTALDEISSMQNSAIEQNYPYGINQSYQMIARIYHLKALFVEAADYYRKAAEVVTAMDMDNPDRQGICYLYSGAASEYIAANMADEAEKMLVLARQNVQRNSDNFSLYVYYTKLYLLKKDVSAAKSALDTLERYTTPPRKKTKEYLMCHMQYYVLNKEYGKALTVCDELINNSEDYPGNPTYLSKAQILRDMGRYEESIKCYQRHIDISDSVRAANFKKDVADKAIIYKLKDITAENQRHEIAIRNRWLVISISFVFLLIVTLVVISRQYRKIKKLNDYLKLSDQIKASFLRNLSHEVRTPLNSIVGFSDVIDDSPDMSREELKECTKIIKKNSKELLKLFTEAHEEWDVRSSDVESS